VCRVGPISLFGLSVFTFTFRRDIFRFAGGRAPTTELSVSYIN
jgi:hypothetical protein